MDRRAGFTLLEICLAVAIGLLLTLIAVPSIQGLLEEQRLHQSMESFDLFVAKAQARSVKERRTLALVWERDRIDLLGVEKKEGDAEELESFPTDKEHAYTLERPAALGPKPDPVWTFWRSGACEPVIVSYQGPEGTWRVAYEALTARRTVLEEKLK